MRIERDLSPDAVLVELGQRAARRRLDLALTQAEVARDAGLGKRTIERIEAGGDTQLSSFVRLLRVLELMDGVEGLVPETGPRPMEMLKQQGKERQRARSKGASKAGEGWRWGDER